MLEKSGLLNWNVSNEEPPPGSFQIWLRMLLVAPEESDTGVMSKLTPKMPGAVLNKVMEVMFPVNVPPAPLMVKTCGLGGSKVPFTLLPPLVAKNASGWLLPNETVEPTAESPLGFDSRTVKLLSEKFTPPEALVKLTMPPENWSSSALAAPAENKTTKSSARTKARLRI